MSTASSDQNRVVINTTSNTVHVTNAEGTTIVVSTPVDTSLQVGPTEVHVDVNTNNTEPNRVEITDRSYEVVTVNTLGPQGPQGTQGEQGPAGPSLPFDSIGNNTFATTSSIQVSGSFLVSGSSTFTNIGPAVFSGSIVGQGVSFADNLYQLGNTNLVRVSDYGAGSVELYSPNVVDIGNSNEVTLEVNNTNDTIKTFNNGVNTGLNLDFGNTQYTLGTPAGTNISVNPTTQTITIIGNLDVYGTASITYTSASTLDVGTNTISVNVGEPAERFGGLVVYDSGSLSHAATSSLLWDSLNNKWVYQNASGSTYSGGMLISGPRNTSTLGSEVGTTNNALMKGQGGDHITSSGIFEDASGSVTFGNNLMYISSSGRVGIGTSTPTYPLHVQHIGTSGVTGSLVFYNQDNSYTSLGVTSNGVGFALSSHTNGTGYISANSSLNFTAYNSSNPSVLWMGNGSRFRVSNTAETETYLTIATNGNVLVNTTVDSGYKFDVSGSARISGSLIVTGSNLPNTSTVFQVLTGRTTSSLKVVNDNSIEFGANRKIILYPDVSNNSGAFISLANTFKSYELYSNNANSGCFFIYNRTDSKSPIVVTPDKIGLGVDTNFSSTTLAGAALIVTASNVGIGGAIPNTRVTIQDSGNYHIFMDRANSTPGGNNPVFAVYNSSSISVATYGWGWYDSSADGNLSLWRRNLSTTGVQVVDFNRSNGNVSFTNNIVATGSIATGVANSTNGTIRIERSGGNVGLIIRGSDGNIVGAGNAPVYEPYNYADASHNFNIGHGSAGNYNWFAGTNATLNLNTQLMRLTRGGNLLIGTTTDSGFRLDVSGSFRTSDGNIHASSSRLAPAGGWTNGPQIMSYGSIWSSAFGPRTMAGGMQILQHTANVNPPISKLSFLVGSDNNTPTERMYVTSLGKFGINGGASFTPPFSSNEYNITLATTAPATSGTPVSSSKYVLKGQSWNSIQGSMPTIGYIQMLNVTNNANPTVEKLSFFVGSADSVNSGDTNGNAVERFSLRTDGIATLSGSLNITGSSNSNLLRIDSPTSSSILVVSGSGNVGIGTSTPTNTLDIVSTTTGSLRISGSAGSQITLVRPTAGLFGYVRYLGSSMDIGTNGTDPLRLNTNNTTRISIGETGFVGIGMGASTPSSLLQVRGSGATSATTALLVQNSTPTNLLSVLDNGQVSFTSPTMPLAASQSAFSISPIISASNVVGGQYYGVSITPTFYQTTGSQTETAFRVAATFTSSNATATTGSNIIADFGSTSAGSQLTVTDVTSGSIYMVNDVSGLPIIEATSNWDVNIYDFPNKVFEKTGSQVNIYGTMRVSGSFILPLSQSVAPQTGSAYWSGSFLFIYDGTRYRSSSFA